MSKKILYVAQKLKAPQQEAIRQAASNYDVRFHEDSLSSAELTQVEILFGWPRDSGTEILTGPTSSLKWLQAISAGVDYLDLNTIQERDILLSNGSGIHSIAIAESVLGMLLARERGLHAAAQAQLRKEWLVKPAYNELYNQNMLIVGAGQIGQRLATVASALGLNVYGVNRSGRQLPAFKEVYPTEDFQAHLSKMSIVVNILPLTEATKDLYNESLFAQMQPGTSFINVGRGESVNTSDLIAALESGQIGFAGLDVFETEPLPASSPLWEMPNVLITPHTAGLARHFTQRLTEIFLANLDSYQTDGQLTRNQVDLSSGY